MQGVRTQTFFGRTWKANELIVRCSLKLFEADSLLEYARFYLAQNDKKSARENLTKVKVLIEAVRLYFVQLNPKPYPLLPIPNPAFFLSRRQAGFQPLQGRLFILFYRHLHRQRLDFRRAVKRRL